MLNILVIDDDKVILKVYRLLLRSFHHNVVIVSKGVEGIDLFDKDCFDLVITDIKMKGVDGNNVAEHIRKSKNPYTQIIGITSDITKITDANLFDRIIQKPFTIDELRTSISDLFITPSEVMNG